MFCAMMIDALVMLGLSRSTFVSGCALIGYRVQQSLILVDTGHPLNPHRGWRTGAVVFMQPKRLQSATERKKQNRRREKEANILM